MLEAGRDTLIDGGEVERELLREDSILPPRDAQRSARLCALHRLPAHSQRSINAAMGAS